MIVQGYAKSAGTIIAMSADEIFMDAASSLGPIDAQIQWQGKVFSADALLEGMKRIKKEVEDTGILNKAGILRTMWAPSSEYEAQYGRFR